MERNTLLSPRERKEGLLEGVQTTSALAQGCVFFPCHLARRREGDRDSLSA